MPMKPLRGSWRRVADLRQAFPHGYGVRRRHARHDDLSCGPNLLSQTWDQGSLNSGLWAYSNLVPSALYCINDRPYRRAVPTGGALLPTGAMHDGLAQSLSAVSW